MRRTPPLLVSLFLGACGGFGSNDDAKEAPPSGTAPGSPSVGGPAADYGFTIDALPSPSPIVQGTTTKVKVTVKRGSQITEPIAMRVIGLREGITVAPLVITGDSGELEITVPAALAQGPTEGLIEATSGALKVTTPLKAFVRGKPGDIDTTFGVDGFAMNLAGIGMRYFSVRDVVVAPDDSLFVIAQCERITTATCVSHLMANGTADKTYGSSGVGELDIRLPNAAVLQPDGRLVIVGGFRGAQESGLTQVGRLDAVGRPDRTFSDSGARTIDGMLGFFSAGFFSHGATGVALRPDGDIVVAIDTSNAVAANSGRDYYTTSIRMGKDGELRASYGAGGVARGTRGLTTAMTVRANSAAPLNGDVVTVFVRGEGASAVSGMFQVNGDTGVQNPTFELGRQGLLVPGARGVEASGPGLIELSDGSIVTAIQANGSFNLRKFGPSGSDVADFGVKGVAGPFAVLGDVTGMAVQKDGKILVSLNHRVGQEAIRFTSNGEIDAKFGDNGRVKRTFGDNSAGRRVVVQKNGRILLNGETFSGNGASIDGSLTAYWP